MGGWCAAACASPRPIQSPGHCPCMPLHRADDHMRGLAAAHNVLWLLHTGSCRVALCRPPTHPGRQGPKACMLGKLLTEWHSPQASPCHSDVKWEGDCRAGHHRRDVVAPLVDCRGRGVSMAGQEGHSGRAGCSRQTRRLQGGGPDPASSTPPGNGTLLPRQWAAQGDTGTQ